ncbi:hypothetical protein AWENTII_002496 [Aspergillus wentii]
MTKNKIRSIKEEPKKCCFSGRLLEGFWTAENEHPKAIDRRGQPKHNNSITSRLPLFFFVSPPILSLRHPTRIPNPRLIIVSIIITIIILILSHPRLLLLF